MSETLEHILPEKIECLAHALLANADRHNLALATAESCTGGLLAALLTDVEGLSHVFERGFVTYSDQAKCDLLDIAQSMVDDCGAVSREVAVAMAKGAKERSRADIAVSITGFAGPAGEDDEEGLVHFACIDRNGRCVHAERHFGAIGRNGVRIAALETALTMMNNAIPDG
ncbi:MAG: CinA family protein [Sphingomonadaceae bacterium]|nr:MAG: CinA family protein [Sphingomonadaceae bacterium]